MRALRYLRRRFRGTESVPLDVRVSLVGALYQDYRSLVIGSVAAIITSLISAWKTHEPSLYLCALAIVSVFLVRALDFKAFAKRAEIDTHEAAIVWEARYVTGAACHVALLGLWCLVSFARTSDPSVQLLSFAMTLAYLIGVSGRNFASRPLVISQIVCAGVPMAAALLIAGSAYYVTIAFVLAPFFLALKLISERLRAVFLNAVVSGRNVGLMATQLDAALNNMAQGVCMFDAAQRIVVCNERYAEMYGLTCDQVKPGTTLRQIVEHRIANGFYAGATPEDYMRERLAPVTTATNIVQELSDGRAIAIARRPMPGGGWVITHHDVSDQRRNEARIAHMAHHDALTDLPNRALLNEHLQHALERVKRGEVMAIHLVDLDHFKNVNDTQGHPAGDKLLNLVADRLRALRRETDTIARMGGDEFAIVQVAISQPADAAALANRIIEVVSEPYEIDGRQVIIGTSVGIAMAPSDGDSPDELMRNADLALYRAKGEGRGTFHFFEPEMHARVLARRAMESDLRKALGAGEFELHYQPTVNLNSNQISGFEALIRWCHPERGMIPPTTFIPLAEENGFIVPLGEWVIREACATAARWPEHTRMAVNLSPEQFRSTGLMKAILDALAASGMAANRLELEITETSLLQDTEATLTILDRLRSLGVCIALDDFGRGYSSLSYLQRFPFDRIKIDRSFVNGIVSGVGSRNIVRAVMGIAKGMGMATTAEGVETHEQVEILRSEGCNEMQGFLVSQARPAHEIEQLFLPSRRVDDTEAKAA